MGDPVLALKFFCLFGVIAILLYIVFIVAKLYRITYGKIKLFPSAAETYLFIVLGIDVILCVLSLLWSIIAWIIS